MIICGIIVHLLVIVRNKKIKVHYAHHLYIDTALISLANTTHTHQSLSVKKTVSVETC